MRLLAELHARLPRDFRVEASGHPEVPGGRPEPRRYHLRVAFQGEAAAKAEQPAFIVALAQQADGGWRVAFVPTYHSMFVTLYGEQGEQFFRRAVALRGRGRERQLEQWQSASARSGFERS